ncbi:MAG: ACT domain-containing protein [Candidatus Methanomethylicia archaeon]|nr:ACT domain-containing protein [Candidatus Methanomethylicia archaeon]
MEDVADKYVVIIAIGPDRSGLIAEITSVIADFGCNIEDMDQVVMHGIFILSLLVNISPDVSVLEKMRTKLQYRCHELGLEVTFYYAGTK